MDLLHTQCDYNTNRPWLCFLPGHRVSNKTVSNIVPWQWKLSIVFGQLELFQHLAKFSKINCFIDIVKPVSCNYVANTNKTIVTTEDNTKVPNQPARTYLCPLSDCVFICPTLQDGEVTQHLQSCHGDSDYTGNKFIKLWWLNVACSFKTVLRYNC